MAEVSAAAAPVPEGVLHRRIEFHAARRPHAAAAVGGGGFQMETLNPDAAGGAATAAAGAARGEAEARRPEKAEALGLDPELTVARIYLGRIGAGLQNLGNTCYLNSVLQCLTYTEPFAAYLQSGRHKSSCRTAGFCALCALQNHVKTALQSTGKIVTPSQIVKNLRCISRSFRNSRQEDAHELMVNLLESMHKCCLPSGVPSESASAYEKSLVHRIFGGRLRSQVKCTRCSHCSNTFDPFLDLSLDIGKATTLVRALQNFTEDELLDGGQKQYQCERCRQKVVAKKRFTIDRAPNVLTVHLKRFSPFRPREKIDKKVDFQPVLDLKPFMSDSKGADYKYSLYGVLVHAGWSTQSGHYYCFVRTSSGMWHNLDDNQVRQVREADVLKQKAYMLFYVRDRIGNTLGRKDNSTPNLPVNKMIPGKISSINGVIGSGVMEAKSSGLTSSYANKKLQSTSNAHSSVSSMTLVDHCSTNAGKAETAAALQNSVLPSAQKALGPQNDGATLSTKSKQVASSSHKEASSSGQLASSNQTMAKMSLQEPKAGGALAKLGNNTSIASSMVSGPAGLSETDKQTSCSQTCSKPSSNLVGTITGFTAQTFQTKDAVLSNGVIPSTSSGDPVSSEKMKDLTGSLKQDDHVVKALTMSKKEKTILPGLEQVDVGKQISSQVSTKVVPGDSCNGRMTKRVDSKSKKLVRYPVMKLWLRPRQLSLKQQKKKRKKTKKRVKGTPSVDCSGDNSSEQQTSTSATVPPKTAASTSRKRKHAHASASSENDTQAFEDRQQAVGASNAGAGDDNMTRNRESGTSARAEPPKLGSISSTDKAHSRNNVDAKRGAASQQVVIRTEDLRAEVTVPCWDDVAVPNSETREYKSSGKKSIGYVLDEWDEEYDRGKAKKVRKAKEDEDDDGMNPFQAEANYVSARKTKQNSYKSKPWDKPARPSR
ncbi:ubiquitin carboxyl-terminal hydrolase 23 isoform X1 [Aegilops tauschii subsp. strangulata]|uniref:Ubiquitin carboxyl-terminal hydrolase n=6 Tax=Aegilops tauschii subsp. strangulata TaxID=200361 RepID=A0A453QZ33_AEGTS|nr:ubiquitin carboxyl-terminal hydrolase 23 [Aegilops tauschii subsp. strangulata]